MLVSGLAAERENGGSGALQQEETTKNGDNNGEEKRAHQAPGTRAGKARDQPGAERPP